MVEGGGGGIYLFCGEERFLKEEVSNRIVSALLPPESRKLNCDRYSAKDENSDFFSALSTLPFLSDKKIVVIRDIESLPEVKKNSFLAYLKHPSNHVYLILESNQAPFKNKFIKTISHYAKTQVFNRPDRRGLRDWIYKRLNKYKKEMTKEALELFLELKGSESVAVLSGELDKLATYKGAEKTINPEDVAILTGKSMTKSVFDLVDAISFKDRESALSLAHELFFNNRKGMPEIMGLMGWQLRRLWRAKELLADKKSRCEISRELKIKNFSIDKFLNQVNRFSTEELKRGFRLLVEVDRNIKVGYNKPAFLLEGLIIKLCSA